MREWWRIRSPEQSQALLHPRDLRGRALLDFGAHLVVDGTSLSKPAIIEMRRAFGAEPRDFTLSHGICDALDDHAATRHLVLYE